MVFTTYLPPGTAALGAYCGGDIGSGRAYVIDALTGGGLIVNDSYVVTEFITLVHAGIPPAATVIYTDDSETYTDSEGNTQTNKRTKPTSYQNFVRRSNRADGYSLVNEVIRRKGNSSPSR